MKIKIIFKNLIPYLFIFITSILLLIVILQLWKADLSIPFGYAGDAVSTSYLIKSIVDNGWFLHNDYVGVPFGLNMQDYPLPGTLNFVLIKLIALFIKNFSQVLNLYYLITYPLTAIISLYVFKKLNFTTKNSIVSSLLFAFLPYHFLRGETHLFLASYYTIPLVVLVCLWIYTEQNEIIIDNIIVLKRKTVIISIITCVLVSSSDVYYAFFASFFILVSGICSIINTKKFRKILTPIFLILIIFLGVIINLSPTLIYHLKYGDNPAAHNVSFAESEIYGLKITHLLFPVDGHRVSFLANKKEEYNKIAPLNNENHTETLGVLGSAGFLLLLLTLFLRKRYNVPNIIVFLSELNISAILLATIGGFGTIFAFIVSPQIRGYNRISVFISFFSLIVIAYILDKLYGKNIKKVVSNIIVCLLFIFAIVDQTSYSFVPNYQWIKTEFENDKNFISKVESIMPANSMIFQLPYVNFPGTPPVVNLGEYDLFKGYLHSTKLRWSFGAMGGREGAIWLSDVSQMPLSEMIKKIVFAGFNGIYIDRFGYKDRGADIEGQIRELINENPVISNNNRLVFYDLRDYISKEKLKLSDAEWESKKEKSLELPLILNWMGGFSSLEIENKEFNHRWSSNEGNLVIFNHSKEQKAYLLKMSLSTGYAEMSNIQITGDLVSEKLLINNKETKIESKIVIPPGRHEINFKSDAQRVNAPQDPRYLVFRVNNFSLVEVN